MMNKNLLINLPEDVFVTNILLSKVLPAKSLLSLKCVCKYLLNLIQSPAFIKMQISKELNNNNPLVLIKATDPPNVFFSLKFNGDDLCHPDEEVEFVSPIEGPKIWGSFNGVVCLVGKGDTVCLWNPFTKEYKVLPPPLPPSILEIPMAGNVTGVSLDKISINYYGFGYDRLLDDYKIIRCSEHYGGPRCEDGFSYIPITKFQVYTLATNTWRNIDNNPYKSFYVVASQMINKSVVFVNGALHWIMSASDWFMVESSEKMPLVAKIVSFDIEKEVFQEIQTPFMAKFIPHRHFYPVIAVLRGCLCLLEHDSSTETFCNVWMMMDYGVGGSWTKLFTILRAEVSRPYYRFLPSSYILLRFCENGTEILILVSYDTIFAYDLINNKARLVELGDNFGDCLYQSEVYIESLVSLNSK